MIELWIVNHFRVEKKFSISRGRKWKQEVGGDGLTACHLNSLELPSWPDRQPRPLYSHNSRRTSSVNRQIAESAQHAWGPQQLSDLFRRWWPLRLSWSGWSAATVNNFESPLKILRGREITYQSLTATHERSAELQLTHTVINLSWFVAIVEAVYN